MHKMLHAMCMVWFNLNAMQHKPKKAALHTALWATISISLIGKCSKKKEKAGQDNYCSHLDKNKPSVLAMVALGCMGTKESFLISVHSWMVFWRVIHSEKFHPLWPILEKRMNLKIHPFSHELSVLGRFRWFLVKRMKHNFSHWNYTDSYAWRVNCGGMDDSWK